MSDCILDLIKRTWEGLGIRKMMRDKVDRLAEGAADTGVKGQGAMRVTVLTSDDDADGGVMKDRCDRAVASGCEGIVCAAPDLPATDPWSDRLVRVVPGIRMPGGAAHDQARVASPREALDAGADLLVVGRAVTAAEDPVAAAVAMVDHLVA